MVITKLPFFYIGADPAIGKKWKEDAGPLLPFFGNKKNKKFL